MWERYGFYVVQTLLVLYLVTYHNWDDVDTYPIIGAFTALTYLSPVIGGWIADHLLGQKRSILLGAILLLGSYVFMGYFLSINGLMFSLAGIAVGTGLLKPNISSLLGHEYPERSPIRERGFTIFYLGITSGIIFGTILPSFLQRYLDWSAAFYSAAFGMTAASIIFTFGIFYFKIKDYTRYKHNIGQLLKAILFVISLFFISHYILKHAAIANILFCTIGVFSAGYLLSTIKQESGFQAKQTIIIGILCLISIMFWTFYFQMFSSIMVFLKRVSEPTLFGIAFPPPYYVAIQSFGMILFGFFLGRKQEKSNTKKRISQAGNKFVIAMVLMCIAYSLLCFFSNLDTGNLLISPLYFIPAYLVISMAELFLSPVGLSSMTLLASPNKVSTMMGIFFVSLGLGGYLSGKLATVAAIPKAELDTLNLIQLKAIYAQSFKEMFLLLMMATLISILLNLYIKKLMCEQ